MLWNQIIGHKTLIAHLRRTVVENRVSHAQLFVGPEGSQTLSLAIAYASEILCNNQTENCYNKVKTLQHPDLHFSYPVASTPNVKDKPTSKQFYKEWRAFLVQNPNANIYDWMQFLGIEKKQGLINVHEANEIVKSLSLNSYEGGHRVMIIWMPETMNNAAANKLLKIIEEPPKKTIFLLVAERDDVLLPTITSRCQLVKVNRLKDEDISEYLQTHKGITEVEAKRIAYSAQGNLREAVLLINESKDSFENYFVQWVRLAFMAAKNPKVLKDLVAWSVELSTWSREQQKQFLSYCSEVFRQALLNNYQAKELVFMQLETDGFNWDKFSPYIHGANIEDILNELSTTTYHIERNANAKIVLLDLSIRLTRLLHKKQLNAS